MSLHPSLRKAKGKSGTFRSVLKRHERVRHLMSQGRWILQQSVFGLPKIKQERIKARKAAPKEAAATEQAAAATPAQPASGKAPSAS